MILYLFIWFGSSIIISLLLARIIGRSTRMIFDEDDVFEYGDWFVKNTAGQQTYWDNNEYSTLTKLDPDLRLRKSNKMKVNLN